MEVDEVELGKEDNHQVLKVLEALKQASIELQTSTTSKSSESDSPATKALLELETEADAILSNDPQLSTLSHHLSNLRTLIESFHKSSNRHGLRSFLIRRFNSQEISRVAGSIESEIQAWIDRESIDTLTRCLQRSNFSSAEEQEVVDLIESFKRRISEGFDRELQDLILKSKVFGALESVLCSSSFSKKVREKSAFAISELIRFNKDVFVGQLLMGRQIIQALISIASVQSLKVVCSLIKSIKSPLVDEIESTGQIPKIITLLSSEDLSIRTMAMDCVLEIGYYGRKEAIEAMMKEGLVKKLVELQRSELGGDLIDVGRFVKFLEGHPFASCVARFAVQLEVGEGLRQREKRAFKQEILKRVKEASLSDAEAATIIAEVLWGSSP